MTEEPFGSRLRRERERRRIALSSVSANTRISVTLLEALERGDLSGWPAGIRRRACIRAYAEGIGLDPDAVARDFFERFPDPAEAPATTAATPSACSPDAADVLRLMLPEGAAPFIRGCVLADMRRRWAAVACDAGVVTAIAAIAFVACGSFWLPLGISTLGYYLGGILLLGNTPGVCLWAPTADVRGTPGSEPRTSRS